MAAKRSALVFVFLMVFLAVAISAAPSKQGKKWKKVLDGAKISLVDAIQKAEKKTGGKALAAEMEMEGGKTIMDVLCLKGGDDPSLVEVEINGETGKIQEIEAEGDEDDKDDDDHDDDDDDDKDDKDDDDKDDD